MFYKNDNPSVATQTASVIAELNTQIKTKGAAVSTQESIDAMLSGESLTSEQNSTLKSSVEGVKSVIDATGLTELVMAHLGVDNADHPLVKEALERSATIVAAAASPSKYQRAFTTPNDTGTKAKVLSANIPGIDTMGMDQLAGESFEGTQLKEYLSVSAVVAALSTSSNSFEQLFYPTTVLPAGKSGVDISVRVPYAYQLKARDANAGKYNEAKERKSLVHAIRDNSILRNLANKIIPNAIADHSGVLADVSLFPNVQEEVNGVKFDKRPLAFGKDIDLLKVSKVSGLAGNGVQTQTDVLARNVAIESVGFTLTDSETTPVVKSTLIDVSALPGVNFHSTAEGAVTSQALQFTSSVFISSTDAAVTGGDLAGLTVPGASGEWTIEIELTLNGSLDESGNVIVYANRADIVSVTNDGTKLGSAEVQTVKEKLSVSAEGWYPKAARTNSNVRERGTVIDAGTPVVYRIPVLPGSPLTAICPVGTNGEVDVSYLAKANRVRNSNNAILTTLDFEQIISRTNNLPDNYTTVGSAMGVTPTYVKSTLDVKVDLERHSSMNGYDDLRVGITNALSVMADQLAVKSGYLSVLELDSGSSENYEIILGSDPQLAGLIMTSGDARALGAGYNFKVAKTHDTDMTGKIYMSFRRTDKSGPDGLSFGFHAEMPALVYNTQINNTGDAFQELQFIPRSQFAVTCPILGVLEVKNIDSVFSTPA